MNTEEVRELQEQNDMMLEALKAIRMNLIANGSTVPLMLGALIISEKAILAAGGVLEESNL